MADPAATPHGSLFREDSEADPCVCGGFGCEDCCGPPNCPGMGQDDLCSWPNVEDCGLCLLGKNPEVYGG